MNTELMHRVAAKLLKSPMDKTMLIGFDGTVDEIVEAVDSRYDKEKYKRLETIQDFANRISGFANVSGNIEFVVKQEKVGGNGPIMANALLAMGYPIHFVGNIGTPDVHPIFKEMVDACVSVSSLGAPAYTNAVEFSDGKIMFTRSSLLNSITWDAVVQSVGEEKMLEFFSSLDFFAANNWSQTAGMNEIWQGMIALLRKTQRAQRIKLFFDLADPRKRLPQDIITAIGILTEMNTVADVILGLNKNEAKQIAGLYNLHLKNEEPENMQQLAVDIREKLQLAIVVIHPTEFACAATNDASARMTGPYTPHPKLSTGAGDNFNAGFCNGLLCGFDLEEALLVGVASSGYYVRNGYSPNKEQLSTFLQGWASGRMEE